MIIIGMFKFSLLILFECELCASVVSISNDIWFMWYRIFHSDTSNENINGIKTERTMNQSQNDAFKLQQQQQGWWANGCREEDLVCIVIAII